MYVISFSRLYTLLEHVMVIFVIIINSSSCQNSNPRFVERALKSGIDFQNTLSYTNNFNPYTYRNFYNGGGVALGDVNNDGFIDIYFTGNIVDNKLYLNNGDWTFLDITEQAGVACKDVWSTGATFIDINADGLLDIYVCKSGKPGGNNRHNELFINNGDLTYREESKKYGLDIEGLSVHAAFFDFDLDGDLDCYVLNNSSQSVGGFDLIKDQRYIPDSTGQSNKLLENVNGKFFDVSEDQGIYTSSIGFGLGITLGDFNLDRRPDLFISNDFFERDYLYFNSTNGYQEVLEDNIKSTSMGSMGADAADLDNDLYPDLMVTEMLPSSIQRQKTKALYETWDKYSLAVAQGYSHQYPRNTIQRNVGSHGFVELGRYAGVMATDWSWASLIFDADNDGLKDIFVANGIFKDLLDRDYLDYTANDQVISNLINNNDDGIKELIDLMPSKAIPNVAFKNDSEFKFIDVTSEWGLDAPSFSNGSAYGDLDNDGDLDLVINNVNSPAFVYQNTSPVELNNYLSLELKSASKNTRAIGAKVIISYGDRKKQMVEQFPSKGFQSSISNRIHFGLGKYSEVDSLMILWPSGMTSVETEIPSNQHVVITEPEISNINYKVPISQSNTSIEPLFNFLHKENNWSDFNREQLLPSMHSNWGPAMASGDVNGDGIRDIFVGGAKNQGSVLWLSNQSGYIEETLIFEKNKRAEDVVAEFLDINGDDLLDLYVGTSGRAFSHMDNALRDRIYLNKGAGNLEYMPHALPRNFLTRTSSINSADFNKDGNIDLFITQHIKGDYYGIPSDGYLLTGNGQGQFKLEETQVFQNLGMLTDAIAVDVNQDTWLDLVVVGEWMDIELFINKNGKFFKSQHENGLSKTNGIWTAITSADFDGDGDADLIAGNSGTNSFFREGTLMLVNDFDKNGSVEQIICHPIEEDYYPVVDRMELVSQLPMLKRFITSYQDYSEATINDLFTQEQIANSFRYELEEIRSCYFENDNGEFVKHVLPEVLQYAPIYAIDTIDINNDGVLDILFGGNQYLVKPQFGRYDASSGHLLLGTTKDGEYNFDEIKTLGIEGQIRNFELIKKHDSIILVSGINNNEVIFFLLH